MKKFNNLDKIIKQIESIAEQQEKMDWYEEYPTSFSLGTVESRVVKRPSDRDIERFFDDVNKLAIQYIRDELKLALDAAMSANIWGGGDDIVDTGELMNSLEVRIENNRVIMAYTAEYASLIHYGGYIAPYGNKSAKKVYIPGRPWVEAVLYGYGGIKPIDLSELYLKAFNQVNK